jgi:hypothetical protein
VSVEHMSLRESFHEYFVDVNAILFNTWDRIFGDVREHFAKCHG